ncbi:MAG TPA: hypothetical protein VNI83_04600 [Vicinamibacterales bacterium]|nr:hypothetical protein [Vicinamibacterales bacterium]
MFATACQETLPVPGDPSHTVTIRRLSALELEEAQRAAAAAATKRLLELGGASVLKELSALGGSVAAPATSEPIDPLQAYDRRLVLRAGIVSWSYERPVTPEAIDEIEPEAAEAIARAILRLTRPSLFASPKDAAEEGKDS